MSILSDREPETEVTQLPDAGARDIESCRSCGGAVAREQRYCLSCGSRRAERRVPFAETLGVAEESAPTAVKAKSGGGVITPGIAAAIVCASVLFLGTGVLVGRSGEGNAAAPAAAPQIVTVPAGGAGDAAVADSGGGGGDAGGKKTKTVKVKSAAAAPVLTGEAKKKLDAAMNCSTPEACQEASKKIPNELATPGKPPPPDNKPPAGGAKGQVFQ